MDVKMIKRLGTILMVVGFLWGSFLSVKHPNLVEWTPYAVAFALMVAGAVALRWAAAQVGGEAEQLSADISTIETSLGALVDIVRKINGDRDENDPFSIPQRIDDECMDTINEFVEAREAMIHKFGLAEYAKMMDSFALGERALNRAWCAAADGYVDELSICLQRCLTHWEKALDVVLAALGKSPLAKSPPNGPPLERPAVADEDG